MNLRVIKKDIEYFVDEFVNDCLLFASLPNANTEEISKIIDEALDLFNNLRDKVNHPTGTNRSYYQGIRKEMFEQLDILSEKLSSEVAKENNK